MEKEYKIALSYAHKDQSIAQIIKTELENIFTDSFFMDELHPEELADASVFKEKLSEIFHRSQYSVILYSKNYDKGDFTQVEKEAILEKMKTLGFSHMFIININDYDIKESFVNELKFISLKVKGSADEGWAVDSDVNARIHEIMHKEIKKKMMDQSMMENQEGEYLINVHTTSGQGNHIRWNLDYDWNVLGSAFVDKGSRVVKEGCEWKDLWNYIQSDFGYLNKNLAPDIKRKINLNCQLGVAFMLGLEYGDLWQKSGNRSLEVSSSNGLMGSNGSVKSFPFEPEINYKIEGFDFCNEYEGNDSESKDVICVIAIKGRNTEITFPTVKSYLESQEQKYCKIYVFQKEMKMEDATTLENMAEYIRKKMALCGGEVGGGYRIHIFPDTAAPLMFILGARTIISGELLLYEFKKGQNTYEVSLVSRQ